MPEARLNEDEEAFRAFEHEGWERATRAYHDGFARLTTQAIGPLLDAVKVAPGTRLLDVATGPGYVAKAAAERGAQVVGLDFSREMLVQARGSSPSLACCEADAERLPFVRESFDAVVMNFGMLHLAGPDQAMQEALRVMRSGGRFAFTVWAAPERAVGFGIVLKAVQSFGTLDVAVPSGSPFFRFSDAAECVRALREAGFVEIQVLEIPQHWRLEVPDALMQIMRSGTVRTAALLRAQSAKVLASIEAAVRAEVLRYQRGDFFELPCPAVLASATRP